MGDRGGFGGGFGGRGDRGGRGRGGPRGGRGRGQVEEQEWIPVTKLGRLVKGGYIKSYTAIEVHSLPIKEHQIVDFFFSSSRPGAGGPAASPVLPTEGALESSGGLGSGGTLKDEVMKIMPVQKQTSAGQRTRFKAFVVVGTGNGHIGLGVKCAKEVATAIRGAIIAAKLALIPVRRGYWGNKIGDPHTVPMKVSGKCGSVRVRLVPAPRGSQIVGAPTTKKMMMFAGLKDAFTSTTGCSKTRGNFMFAIFDALSKTYKYLTPDLWKVTVPEPSPYQVWSDVLAQPPERKKVVALTS